ncbi:DsbA family oxidoreductase [Dyella amyloliquefaciens]|uniref:DsbA family oxidoreductase n=1 Tax=Dyella amyloliquefaciens TaxID=1770545 RepID=UPI00102EAEAA|nr:DsbA family oxidoreductase [Dyella amyloliquefaciens]
MSELADVTATISRKRIPVDFYFDLICPWCMIGKRQLERATELVAIGYPDVDIDVRWKSLPLLPDMPLEGKPYEAFYLHRLGSADAVKARRQQVRDAGSANGIRFEFERIEWMPNTTAAHRLVEHAGQVGGAMIQSLLIDELFQAYFIRGMNIGDMQVLADIGEIYDMPRAASLERMESPMRDAPLEHWQSEARRERISGVPGFVLGRRQTLSGALPPETLARAMLAALPP